MVRVAFIRRVRWDGRGGGRLAVRVEKPGSGRHHRQCPVLARTGRELLYGRNAVLEALRGRRSIERLFVAEGAREDERLRGLMALATERGAEIERIPRLMLDDATRGANHQGIALEAEPYRYAEFEDLLEAPGTVLVLDHLQDPQNVGTLFRAAEAAGVAGVVIPEDRAAAVTPAVVNASAGAVEHLRVAAVPNLARALEALKGSGRWVAGSMPVRARRTSLRPRSRLPPCSWWEPKALGWGRTCGSIAICCWRCRCAAGSIRSTPPPPARSRSTSCCGGKPQGSGR